MVSQSPRFRFLIVLFFFLGDAAAPKTQQVLKAGSCYDSMCQVVLGKLDSISNFITVQFPTLILGCEK